MKIVYDIKDIKLPASVVTIGNFDGVHIAHKIIINKLVKQAAFRNVPSVLILFEPQPLEFMQKNKAPGRLNNFQSKVSNIKKLNLDYLVCITFNEEISQLSPKEFIKNILFDHLKLDYILVGHDFRFGKNRIGTIDFLKEQSNKYHFEVEVLEKISVNNIGVSSTKIREYLLKQDMINVEMLTGEPYSLYGTVVKGNGEGAKIGVPTANIEMNEVMAINGVFCTNVIVDNEKYIGITNIGIRPTISNRKNYIMEVHIFDYNLNLYGKFIQVDFIKKIRSEKKFATFEELRLQIKTDLEVAREFFKCSSNKLSSSI